MCRRRHVVPVLLVPLLLAASATPTPSVLAEYEYAPDRIYPIRTALGITTQIALDPKETVQDFSAGFSSGWELSRRESVFYIKPKDVDVDTNLMIRTDRRAYIFELKVVATDWKTLAQVRKAGVQYRVGFRYPAEGTSPRAPRTRPTDQQSVALLKDRAYHFNYDMKASGAQRWLLPEKVYDDGRFTYVRLKRSASAQGATIPAVFTRESERGQDAVVNSSVEGDTLIVHGIHRYLILRHGPSVVSLRRNMPR